MVETAVGKAISAIMVTLTLGLVFLIAGFLTYMIKRKLEDTPISKIRSIAIGPVKIYGEVVPFEGRLLKSPFSNKDCVYYKSIIEHKDWNTYKYKKVLEIEKSELFMLKDDTGDVLVDLKGANVDVSESIVREGDLTMLSQITNIPEDYKIPFLGMFSLKVPGFIKHKTSSQPDTKVLSLFSRFLGRYRVREFCIVPGDKIYIYGRADDNPYKAESTAVIGVEDIMIQRGSKSDLYYVTDKEGNKTYKNLRDVSIFSLILGMIFLTTSILAWIAVAPLIPITDLPYYAIWAASIMAGVFIIFGYRPNVVFKVMSRAIEIMKEEKFIFGIILYLFILTNIAVYLLATQPSSQLFYAFMPFYFVTMLSLSLLVLLYLAYKIFGSATQPLQNVPDANKI